MSSLRFAFTVFSLPCQIYASYFPSIGEGVKFTFILDPWLILIDSIFSSSTNK